MKSSLRNMVLVLTLVCLGASAAVAVIYAVTKDPIAAASTAKTNKAIEEVVPAFDNNPSEEVLNIAADLQKPDATSKVYVAKKGGEVVGYAIESTTTKGFGGPFTIMVGFTPNGEVYNTSVISHSETPGLGAKITDSKSHFITQWNGKNLTDGSLNISVKKDGGDIDAITASTISSRAFCDAMQIAANVFNNITTEK
ncbi:MAG: RnfABCDGE type electron transport complex subunit G [Bacteroidales bacterium]|nr:RnfABCDGE type electron transport complex subunit G [Bacteroidales bacterium]